MGQREPSAGLGEVYAPQRLSGVASSVGCGADAVMDRPEQEDEQGLREVMCERGSVGVRCHDSPHDEAARPCLRTFHTASEGEFSEVRGYKVHPNSPGPVAIEPLSDLFGPQTAPWSIHS